MNRKDAYLYSALTWLLIGLSVSFFASYAIHGWLHFKENLLFYGVPIIGCSQVAVLIAKSRKWNIFRWGFYGLLFGVVISAVAAIVLLLWLSKYGM